MSITPNPYVAPAAGAETAAPASWRSAFLLSCICLGVSLGIGIGVLTMVALESASPTVTGSRVATGIGFWAMTLCSVVGVWCSCATVFRAARARTLRATLIALGGAFLFVVHGSMTLYGAFLASDTRSAREKFLQGFQEGLHPPSTTPEAVPGQVGSRRQPR